MPEKKRERKYQRKIRNDPNTYTKAKEKKHEKFLKRKGENKSISDLSDESRDRKRKKKKHKQKSLSKSFTNQTNSEDIDNPYIKNLFNPSPSEFVFSLTNSFESPQSASKLKSG